MNFHMPTKIVFGSGTLSALKGIVGDLRAKRPFLIHFSTIAGYSFRNNSDPSNPRDASFEDYLSILENAL